TQGFQFPYPDLPADELLRRCPGSGLPFDSRASVAACATPKIKSIHQIRRGNKLHSRDKLRVCSARLGISEFSGWMGHRGSNMARATTWLPVPLLAALAAGMCFTPTARAADIGYVE